MYDKYQPLYSLETVRQQRNHIDAVSHSEAAAKL